MKFLFLELNHVVIQCSRQYLLLINYNSIDISKKFLRKSFIIIGILQKIPVEEFHNFDKP